MQLGFHKPGSANTDNVLFLTTFVEQNPGCEAPFETYQLQTCKATHYPLDF